MRRPRVDAERPIVGCGEGRLDATATNEHMRGARESIGNVCMRNAVCRGWGGTKSFDLHSQIGVKVSLLTRELGIVNRIGRNEFPRQGEAFTIDKLSR